MTIDNIIRKHPAYRILLGMVTDQSDGLKGGSVLDTIEIKGVPFSLHDGLIDSLAVDTKKNIIYANRDSLEIRKYFKTTQIIDLEAFKYTDILYVLNNHGFTRVGKVLEPGDFSILGDTIVFWPLAQAHPIKLSYFGDKLESAHIFDEIYGSTIQQITSAIIGDINTLETKIVRGQIMEHLQTNSFLNFSIIFGGDTLDTFESKSNVNFDIQYPQLFFNRFDLLAKYVREKSELGYSIIINSKHADNLPAELKNHVNPKYEDIEAGFVTLKGKVIYLTDRELFGTVFLNKETGKLNSDRARKLLSELEGEIDIGDYIVHEDHGIGIYAGLTQEKYEQKVPTGFNTFIINQIYEDYILIKYAEGDELYVPINQINKITKYIGSENSEPVLTRLGKTEWAVIKRKVKESIAIYAKELVNDIAKRETAISSLISVEKADGYKDFIEKFKYDETPDQLRTEREVMADLNSKKPMNRLIVGDVGFGKTEVAIRAAFVAVKNDYQVAILCPTTVLAAQHEKVFNERFSGFDFQVAGLTRFSRKNSRSILKDISEGMIDIVIGTHRLLSNDIQFKNLGLLIMDEEQKFGVEQKEKIKKLKIGVHVLAMSATPIPRTLSMALSSICDISLIETPPQGRKSIKTIIEKMNWNEICKAIEFEVKRGGQVYFVHNSVQTIQSVYSRLKNLLPDVRFVFAHGQMETSRLEDAVEKFYAGDFDCLICTTIIENGIDMQNVNTIIIEHAQNFGLSQLYQLRGRVGRSDQQAYAYFFYDGEDVNTEDKEQLVEDQNNKGQFVVVKPHPKKYKDRLKALMEAEELGSGFNIASRDLEIRGAGNLLGKQQHGNINFIGYGLYMQLLAQEIEMLQSERKI